MKYAIEVLENELKRLDVPHDEEEGIDGIVDAVSNLRQQGDVIMAIKLLKQMRDNSKALRIMEY